MEMLKRKGLKFINRKEDIAILLEDKMESKVNWWKGHFIRKIRKSWTYMYQTT